MLNKFREFLSKIYLLRSSSNTTSSRKLLIKINLSSRCSCSSQLQNFHLKCSFFIVSDFSMRLSSPKGLTPTLAFLLLSCCPAAPPLGSDARLLVSTFLMNEQSKTKKGKYFGLCIVFIFGQSFEVHLKRQIQEKFVK